MILTLTQYVSSRQISESTVKRHLKKLGITLPENPSDRRSRLVGPEDQARLDISMSCSHLSALVIDAATVPNLQTPIAAAAAVDAAAAAVDAAAVDAAAVEYHRSDSASMIIAEAQIIKAQNLIPYQRPDENPLLVALRRDTAAMQTANLDRYNQIRYDNHTQRETQQAIAAARLIRLMESAQKEAFETHQLKKQMIAAATTDLELLELEFDSTPDPIPQTSPQTIPIKSLPDWF